MAPTLAEGQRGDDGQRMHQAFVKDAEDDVDGEQSGENENGFGAEGLLVGLQGAGEEAVDGGGHAHALLHLADGEGGVAEGDAGSEIEGDGDGRKEAGVVERERGGVGLAGGHGEEWDVAGGGDAAAAIGMEIDVLETFGTLPILGSDFEHNVVLVQLGVDDGNFGLTEGAVECPDRAIARSGRVLRRSRGRNLDERPGRRSAGRC